MKADLGKLMEKLPQEKGEIRFINGKKSFSTLEELITYSIKPTTSFGNRPYGVPKTIKGKREQQLGSSRSLKDLFIIARTYFPETRVEDVYGILKTLGENGKINTWHCCTFGKRMFQYQNGYKDDLTKYFKEPEQLQHF